jgi:signal transduction histidine kinase
MTIAGAVHFTLIVRDVTERRLMKEMKRRSDQRLHQLSEERMQLYHDLHSSLLQSLSAVSMGLEATKLLLEQSPDRAPKQLDRTLSHLRRVIQETRDYITRLEPRTASHERFLQSIQMLVQSKEDWPCPPFHIDIDPLTDGLLSIDQEIHLLSIAREAVSNIVHHAQAQTGIIRLGSWEDRIQLEIKDNGRGFSPTEISLSSPGLTNMSTHTKKLHGRLTIAAAPGEGTTILVAIPLSQEAQHADGLAHAN